MTLNVNANSLLATFIDASKMAKKNQDEKTKLLFGKKLDFDVSSPLFFSLNT